MKAASILHAFVLSLSLFLFLSQCKCVSFFLTWYIQTASIFFFSFYLFTLLAFVTLSSPHSFFRSLFFSNSLEQFK